MVCLAGPEELCIRVNESNNQTCEVKRLKSDGSMTFWLSDNSIVSVRFDREDYSMTVGWSDYTLVTSVFSKFNVVLINNQNGAVQQIDPETQITIGPLTIGPNWKISINDIGTNVPPDIILPDGLILVRTENNQYIAFFENGPNEIVHRTNLPEYLSNSIQETFRLVGINFGDLESTNYLYTNNAKEAADKGYFFEPPSEEEESSAGNGGYIFMSGSDDCYGPECCCHPPGDCGTSQLNSRKKTLLIFVPGLRRHSDNKKLFAKFSDNKCITMKSFNRNGRDCLDETSKKLKAFVKQLADDCPYCKIIVAGQSMGGNIAAKAASQMGDANFAIDMHTFASPLAGTNSIWPESARRLLGCAAAEVGGKIGPYSAPSSNVTVTHHKTGENDGVIDPEDHDNSVPGANERFYPDAKHGSLFIEVLEKTLPNCPCKGGGSPPSPSPSVPASAPVDDTTNSNLTDAVLEQ